jgi:hypothetical protein
MAGWAKCIASKPACSATSFRASSRRRWQVVSRPRWIGICGSVRPRIGHWGCGCQSVADEGLSGAVEAGVSGTGLLACRGASEYPRAISQNRSRSVSRLKDCRREAWLVLAMAGGLSLGCQAAFRANTANRRLLCDCWSDAWLLCLACQGLSALVQGGPVHRHCTRRQHECSALP